MNAGGSEKERWSDQKGLPVIACLVDDQHVVVLQQACPIYMLSLGHQQTKIDSRKFRFMGTPSDLLCQDRFDTLVLDEQDIEIMLEAAGQWVDITCYASSVDIQEVQTALNRHNL